MAPNFKVGDRVRLAKRPPYIKTADPMPMLRPPDLVPLGEEGQIIDVRPGGYFGIKFSQGSVLLDSQYLEKAENPLQEGNSAATSLEPNSQQ